MAKTTREEKAFKQAMLDGLTRYNQTRNEIIEQCANEIKALGGNPITYLDNGRHFILNEGTGIGYEVVAVWNSDRYGKPISCQIIGEPVDRSDIFSEISN